MSEEIESPSSFVGEFANTFKEWHYFAGGLGIGVSVAFLICLARKRHVHS